MPDQKIQKEKFAETTRLVDKVRKGDLRPSAPAHLMVREGGPGSMTRQQDYVAIFGLLLQLIEDLENRAYALEHPDGVPTAPEEEDDALIDDNLPALDGHFAVKWNDNSMNLNFPEDPIYTSYEVRSFKGLLEDAEWETANFEARVWGPEAVVPSRESGDWVFLVKGITSSETRRTEPNKWQTDVPDPRAPNLTPGVIDNNVQIFWTTSRAAFGIQHYIIERKIPLSSDFVELAKVTGLFASFNEPVGGEYEYRVKAVDRYGNESPWTTTVFDVNEPPDYELKSNEPYDMPPETTSLVKTGPHFIVGVRPEALNVVSSGHREFIAVGDESWQDAIDAGWGLMGTPSAPCTCYFGYIDHELTFSSVTVSVQLVGEWIGPEGTEPGGDVDVYTHGENASRTTNPNATTRNGWTWEHHTSRGVVHRNARTIHLRIRFDPESPRFLYKIQSVHVRLDVKLATDSGEVEADASDANGTAVTFNKTFKDVESVVATAKSTTNRVVQVDFEDTPNPTGFKVYLRNANNGRRQSGTVEWVARGVV